MSASRPLSGLVQPVSNDFPVSPGPPGFRWRRGEQPCRLWAGTQHLLVPRSPGVYFRFVQFYGCGAASPYARSPLRKPLAAGAGRALGGPHCPRVRAPCCPGRRATARDTGRLRVRCSPRAREFLSSRLLGPAALAGSGCGCPAGDPHQPSQTPDTELLRAHYGGCALRPAPGLACAPYLGHSVCVPRERSRGSFAAGLGPLWAPGRRRQIGRAHV